MRCTFCGDDIEPGFRFCKNCGNPAPISGGQQTPGNETNLFGTSGRNQSPPSNQTISMGDMTQTPRQDTGRAKSGGTQEMGAPRVQDPYPPYPTMDYSQQNNPEASQGGAPNYNPSPYPYQPYDQTANPNQAYNQPYNTEVVPPYFQNQQGAYDYGNQPPYAQPQQVKKSRTPLIVGLLLSLALLAAGGAGLYFWMAKKPPKIRDINANLSRIQQGDKVTLIADAENTTPDSKFQWLTSGGRISTNGASATLDTTTVDASSGQATVKVTLTVTSGNNETSFDKVFTVYRNENTISSPLIVVLQADQTAVREGETVNLSVEVSNRDEKDVSYEWQASDGVLKDSGKTATLNTSGLNLSQSTRPISVTVTVKDRNGASQSDTQLINVIAADTKNFPPSISVRASKMSVQPGDTVDLFADATDRDGDTVTIAWNAAQGQITGKGSRVRFKVPPDAQGQIAVTATASDTFGNTAKNSVTLTVVPKNQQQPDTTANNDQPPPTNRPPAIQRLYADNNPVRAGDRVTITVEATDPDNDNLVYAWSKSQGTIVGGSNGPSITLDTSSVDTSTGSRQVFVRVAVSDQRGGEEVRTTTLTVLAAQNQQPNRDTPRDQGGGNTDAGNSQPAIRQPGRVSGSVSAEDQETAVVSLSGSPGTPQSSSGIISVTVSGGSVSVTGYLPDTTCIYSFGNAVNVKDGVRGLSMVEPPKGSNSFSRLRVRLKQKERDKPSSFTIVWRKV